mmetsp:Transcript_26359/g.71301  ORF Transcript_26359/g.71301 Transcript_26359/m.71301 type:complete len:139 (+) Transcript_26359:1388-1804(+)
MIIIWMIEGGLPALKKLGIQTFHSIIAVEDEHALPQLPLNSPSSSPAKDQLMYGMYMELLKHQQELTSGSSAEQQQAAQQARLASVFGTPPKAAASFTLPPTGHPSGRAAIPTTYKTKAVSSPPSKPGPKKANTSKRR